MQALAAAPARHPFNSAHLPGRQPPKQSGPPLQALPRRVGVRFSTWIHALRTRAPASPGPAAGVSLYVNRNYQQQPMTSGGNSS